MSQDNVNSAQSQPLRNPLNLRNLTTCTLSVFDVRNWYNIWGEPFQNDQIVENAAIGPVTTVHSCPLCQTNVEEIRMRRAEYEGSPCFASASGRTPGFIEPGQTGGWIFVPDIQKIADELRMEVDEQTPNDEQQPPEAEGQTPAVIPPEASPSASPPQSVVEEDEKTTTKSSTVRKTTATKTSTARKTPTAAKSSSAPKSPKASKPTKRKATSPASKKTSAKK